MHETASPAAQPSPLVAGPSDLTSRHVLDRAALTRRGFLAAAGVGAAGWAVLGTAGGATAQGPVATGGGHGHGYGGVRQSKRAALEFIRVATDSYPDVNPGPRLAQSYADELGLFSTAFVYDNALAINALLASERGVPEHARVLADGLVYAMEHDPVHSDGRLRQGYNVGPYTFYDGTQQPYGFVLPDGTANIGWQFGFLGTAVGDMAWPGVALVQLYFRSRERRYLDAAIRIGEWITTNTWSQAPLGGFSFGVNGANEPVPNGSTEHNIDCVAFFTLLLRATGQRRWRDAAAHARAFVDRMWEPAVGTFYTGTNDGVEINRAPLPLDPATWSWIALRDRRYASSLDWAASALAVTDVPEAPTSQLPDGVTVSGVTFSTASLTSTAQYNGITVHPQGVWLEGTAQLAASYADRGGRRDRHRAEALLDQVRVAQSELGAGQHLGGVELAPGGGVVAASSLIDSGFGFGYFQVQHVGATSWYLMAVEGANPFQKNGLRGH
ncbi:Tat pathway signal sequence domain protein [Cellulomonas sp. NS3]|uniref:Tat pathway signal sequence domain protein n=1 Tax=Cellulomonas sp. NS3 TaxID=2973977 RepID=UPI0021618604|nr:Tat pathway signal sequence domain protein [Cellulomonas sp. NS3]